MRELKHMLKKSRENLSELKFLRHTVALFLGFILFLFLFFLQTLFFRYMISQFHLFTRNELACSSLRDFPAATI